MAQALRLWGPVAFWMAVIFGLSSVTVGPARFPIPDWLTHGAVYLILAVLLCRALAGGLGRALSASAALLAVALSTAYGFSDEAHQAFVPGRKAEASDVLKDFGGGALGAFVYRRYAARPWGRQRSGVGR